jgi:hypothetical protein
MDIIGVATNYKIYSGTYTGDSSVNKSIPHGLGVIPSLIVIANSAQLSLSFLLPNSGIAKINTMIGNTSTQCLAVTIGDTTNFYVGNATSYPYSANLTGETYKWIAFI